MEFLINDWSLQVKSKNTFEAIANIKLLINLLKSLKQKNIFSKLTSDTKIRGIELAPNYYLEQLLNDNSLSRDERLFLKTFIINTNIIALENDILFVSHFGSSNLLGYAYMINSFVVSLETLPEFKSSIITGTIRNRSTLCSACLFNLSNESHIKDHESNLGIRIYENNPKHKVNFGWGSLMDLDDKMAQEVLNTAVPVLNNSGHLINQYDGKYYSFRQHHNNCFHGYIDDTIPQSYLHLLDKF
jgi:hypothetical protein